MTQEVLYVTPKQAADLLCEAGMPIHANTISEWARKGKIPATRLPSGHYRIHRDEITALLATPERAA